MARDGSALAIGGSFTSVNGQERAGLALLGADGALRQAEVNGIVTSGGPLSAVMNLAADGHGFYAVVYSRNGSFEGMLRADWEAARSSSWRTATATPMTSTRPGMWSTSPVTLTTAP